MKVEPKRVKKVDSPLLIIGLGGTGSDALLTIMDKFNRRYELPQTANGDTLDTPERTAYLALDTDLLDLQGKRRGNMKFNPGSMFQLTIPSAVGMRTLPEYITSWLDKNLTGFQIKNGAGGNRQAGRYVFFHNVDAVYEKLKTVIHSLLATRAGGVMGTLEIVLTTGVSGGTGSGTFMDMAYLVRQVMRAEYPMVDYNFLAYIMMPPVNVNKIPNITRDKQSMLEATGFAALKELDFWMNYDVHKYSYVQRYSPNVEVAWDCKPFDNAVLMGNATANGDIIINAYENCLDVLSESVVNFFAHENNQGNGPIALRSHLSNVQMQAPFLTRDYPANYTYMTVGAALSDSQHEEMATYEAKLVFDRIEQLQMAAKPGNLDSLQATPMLGKRPGEEFLEKFMPQDTDYFGEFVNIKPDLDIFTWAPSVVAGSPALHDGYYREWSHECELEAEKFAVEKVQQLSKRFYGMVRDYATDLNYGPFMLTEFLKDSEQGFNWYFNNLTENWGNQEHNIQIERSNTLAEINNSLYPEVMGMSGLAKMAGLWGPVKRYTERCASLFAMERDYEVAKAVAAELRVLRKEIKLYVEAVLPTFNAMLLQKSESTEQAVAQGNLTMARRKDIASFKDLQAYITNAFGDPDQNALAVQVIGNMIDQSQRVRLDNAGKIVSLSEVRDLFDQDSDDFVLQATEVVNGASMDRLIDIKMPQENYQDKVDYVAQSLLPELKLAARTMLPLTDPDPSGSKFITYAYVSIPNNAPMIHEGVERYSATEHLTPKVSDVADMLFWLNTYNCVPMYMYTDLARLENVYNEALARNGVAALHLVQTVTDEGDHILRHDWSLLPSPVVHTLQKLSMPGVVEARQKEIADMLEQALANGAAELNTASNGMEQLRLRLRKENDLIETMDQFNRKLSAIVDDKTLTPEVKIERLKAMGDEGEQFPIEYKSYTEEFAAAKGLKLTATAQTDAQLQLVAENKEKARRMAAAYILYAWYPQIAEQMITQKEMFRKLSEAIAAQQTLINDAVNLQNFVKQFLLLYLSDVFTMGRVSVKYKNHRGDEEELIAKADLTDDEMTVYAQFSPALVLLSVLGSESDTRVDAHARAYLAEVAVKLEKDIDRMSDDEYAALQKKAKDFCNEHDKTADDIRYDKGDLPAPVREQMIDLMEKLRKAAKRLSV